MLPLIFIALPLIFVPWMFALVCQDRMHRTVPWFFDTSCEGIDPPGKDAPVWPLAARFGVAIVWPTLVIGALLWWYVATMPG